MGVEIPLLDATCSLGGMGGPSNRGIGKASITPSWASPLRGSHCVQEGVIDAFLYGVDYSCVPDQYCMG